MLNLGDFGEVLRNARYQSQLTQEEAAEIADVSTETIRNIEHGKTHPHILTVLVLWDIYALPKERFWEYYARMPFTEERLRNIRRMQQEKSAKRCQRSKNDEHS